MAIILTASHSRAGAQFTHQHSYPHMQHRHLQDNDAFPVQQPWLSRWHCSVNMLDSNMHRSLHPHTTSAGALLLMLPPEKSTFWPSKTAAFHTFLRSDLKESWVYFMELQDVLCCEYKMLYGAEYEMSWLTFSRHLIHLVCIFETLATGIHTVSAASSQCASVQILQTILVFWKQVGVYLLKVVFNCESQQVSFITHACCFLQHWRMFCL